jgi:hypothetical protein
VEELGIKELLPAYKDPTLQPKDLLTGVSFASGGSGYDSLTPKLVVGTFLTLILFYFFWSNYSHFYMIQYFSPYI